MRTINLARVSLEQTIFQDSFLRPTLLPAIIISYILITNVRNTAHVNPRANVHELVLRGE